MAVIVNDIRNFVFGLAGDVLELLSPGRIAVSEIKAGIWQRI